MVIFPPMGGGCQVAAGQCLCVEPCMSLSSCNYAPVCGPANILIWSTWYTSSIWIWSTWYTDTPQAYGSDQHDTPRTYWSDQHDTPQTYWSDQNDTPQTFSQAELSYSGKRFCFSHLEGDDPTQNLAVFISVSQWNINIEIEK